MAASIIQAKQCRDTSLTSWKLFNPVEIIFIIDLLIFKAENFITQLTGAVSICFICSHRKIYGSIHYSGKTLGVQRHKLTTQLSITLHSSFCYLFLNSQWNWELGKDRIHYLQKVQYTVAFFPSSEAHCNIWKLFKN